MQRCRSRAAARTDRRGPRKPGLHALGHRKKVRKAIEGLRTSGTIAPLRSPDSYTPRFMSQRRAGYTPSIMRSSTGSRTCARAAERRRLPTSHCREVSAATGASGMLEYLLSPIPSCNCSVSLFLLSCTGPFRFVRRGRYNDAESLSNQLSKLTYSNWRRL